MATSTIHLMHCSMQHSDPVTSFRADLRANLKREPDILSMTETHEMPFHTAMREVGKEFNYTPVWFNKGHDAFMVNNKTGRLKGKGESFGVNGNAAKGPGKRYIQWVRVGWNGVDVWYHTVHWYAFLTSANASLKDEHAQLTRAMITQVQKHGSGPDDYAFYSGDLNDNDDPRDRQVTKSNQLFANAGMASIWDEFKVYPGTHGRLKGGRTIDIIGRSMRDTRIKKKRYRIWPMGRTDHRPISAFYDLVTDKPNPTTPKRDKERGNLEPFYPTKGDKSGNQKDDDIYATGGNVSWKDYQDSTIYKFPQATDSSDTTNG